MIISIFKNQIAHAMIASKILKKFSKQLYDDKTELEELSKYIFYLVLIILIINKTFLKRV